MIKQYEIEGIGKGAFGEIKGNKDFAVKVLKSKDSKTLKSINNEINVMQTFKKHHDIVSLRSEGCFI